MPTGAMHAQPLIPSTHRRDGEDVPSWAARGVATLTRHGATVFRIGELRLAEQASRELALELVAAAHEQLVADGLPAHSTLEHDRVQPSTVREGEWSRTLLPHHDGGHSSYLSPSLQHDPHWRPEYRTYSTTSFTTTAAHKTHQGVFVPEPGEALSVTTYYPLIEILGHAFRYQCGKPAPDAGALARWLGAGLRGAVARSAEHDCPYPALSAFLGLTWPEVEAVGVHYADAEVDTFGTVAPGVSARIENCPCNRCAGDTTRLVCNMTQAALGLSWPQFRARFERWACTERYDLVFGHNLTMLHGGLCGGNGRRIEPVCIVVEKPRGEQYERWLARTWETAVVLG